MNLRASTWEANHSFQKKNEPLDQVSEENPATDNRESTQDDARQSALMSRPKTEVFEKIEVSRQSIKLFEQLCQSQEKR